jgi:transcriptional regulator with XRE-family HTH domain
MPFVALSTATKTEEHIRRRFKEWFDASGQTQKEAGAVIEWEQQTVSCYFRGDQQIDFMRAITWCKHFGYEVEDLLDKSPRPKPENPKLQKWINIFTSQDEDKQDQLLALGPVLAGERPKKTTRGRRT